MARLKRFYVGLALTSLFPCFCAISQSSPTGDSSVHIATPYPSTQVIPQSSALPSGVDNAASSNPAESSDKNTTLAGKKKRGEFLFAPIPVSNQAIHFGFLPVGEYVFRVNPNDKISPPSSLIATGMIATRTSWAIGGGGNIYLHKDRFRITAFGGHGSVGYDIFGVGKASGDAGKSVPLRQHGNVFLADILFRVGGRFYLGPRFNIRGLSAAIDGDQNITLPANIDPNDLGVHYSEHGYGLRLQHDTRKDLFYPTNGHTFQLDGDYYTVKREATQILPEKHLDYQQYQPSYNHYLSLTPRHMLAFRGMICTIDGNPPFFEMCQYGAMSDIRGYQPGRYRDRRMFAAQGEYRQILSKRWGYTVFGGLGEVAHSWSEFTGSDLLPGGGTGIRFNLSKKERINLRADIAYGKNGWSWNFSLGEAF